MAFHPKKCPACEGKGILSAKRQEQVKVSLQNRKTYNETMKAINADARQAAKPAKKAKRKGA